MMNSNNMRFAAIISLVIVGVVSRLIPHWPNFTPVLAAALFAGVQFKDKRWAYLVPLATMIISDLFLPYHSTMLFNYGAIALVVFMGTMIKQPKVGNVLVASIAGSVAFFLITNFGSWLIDPYNLYANDFSGLIASYVAALPFAANQWLPSATSFATNTLYSDLVYNGIFFGLFAIAQNYVKALKPATVTIK